MEREKRTPRMGREERAFTISESCFICGNEMTLRTKCTQDVAGIKAENGLSDTDVVEECSWYAYDGDTVECLKCGAQAWASVDANEAYVAYDETTDHNVRCAEKWEAEHPYRPSDAQEGSDRR